MTMIPALILAAAAAYCIGSLNGALLISRFVYREDIREKGSGNAGLTNVLRVYGKKAVPAVLAIDLGKTVLAILAAKLLLQPLLGALAGSYWGALWTMVGHCLPVYHGFRGGKGVLCCGGFLFFLDPRIALVGLGLFLLLVVLTRYVSLGSVSAVASLPFTTVWCYRAEPQFLFLLILSVVIALYVLWGHRANLSRLLRGQENKLSFQK